MRVPVSGPVAMISSHNYLAARPLGFAAIRMPGIGCNDGQPTVWVNGRLSCRPIGNSINNFWQVAPQASAINRRMRAFVS